MSHKTVILNPGAVRRLFQNDSTAPADCAGWLVRVIPSHNKLLAPVLECCWFVLRGNLLMYCDDPESDPKGLIVLENHSVELFDNFDEKAFKPVGNSREAGDATANISTLKEYFTFLSMSVLSGDNSTKHRLRKRLLLSDMSIASSAMQFAFRIFFIGSPTQEPFIFIADSDQSLQMWMRAIALASHEARKIMASSTQPSLVDVSPTSYKNATIQNMVSTEKTFSKIHEDIGKLVMNSAIPS